jgi:hypothetical protein
MVAAVDAPRARMRYSLMALVIVTSAVVAPLRLAVRSGCRTVA